eukprot:scaffold184088_cov18-Tisochrysis_lutea.AAC.1
MGPLAIWDRRPSRSTAVCCSRMCRCSNRWTGGKLPRWFCCVLAGIVPLDPKGKLLVKAHDH